MTRLAAFAGFGIELEYMIVDAATLAVRPFADRLVDPASGVRRRGPMEWSNELALHVVEIKNRAPVASLETLLPAFAAEVAAADAQLAPAGARLMPTAMHPWMDPAVETRLWPHACAEIYAAYDRIFDCRRHGWANVQSMHLNLPFADDAEFLRLHAAVRLVLPILPALAASSPLADGRSAGALDGRMEAYRTHQAKLPATMAELIPEDVAGRAAYARNILAPMYRELAPFDPDGLLRHEWLNARGAIARFSRCAVEVRVIDAQECPRADLAVAAATAAVVRRLYERSETLEAQRAMPTPPLAAILSACIRDAEAAEVADARYLEILGVSGRRCTAGELWRRLLRGWLPAAGPWREPLELTLARGPLARRILRALGAAPSRERLAATYRALCDCLAADRLFEA